MHFLIWRVNVCWSTSRKEQTVCSLTVMVCVCECHTQTERYSMFEYDINGMCVKAYSSHHSSAFVKWLPWRNTCCVLYICVSKNTESYVWRLVLAGGKYPFRLKQQKSVNGTSVQLMQTAKTVYKTGQSSHLRVFAAVYWSRCFISVLPNQLDNQVCRNNSRWLQKVTRYRSLHLNLSQIIISYYKRTTYVPGRFISHKHMLQSPSYVLNAHICEPRALEMHCMNNTYNIHSTIIYCLSVLKMRRMFNNS